MPLSERFNFTIIDYFSFSLLPYLLLKKVSLVLKQAQFLSAINVKKSARPFALIISIALLRSLLSTHAAILSNRGLYFLHSFVEAYIVQSAQVKNSFSTQHGFTLHCLYTTADFAELPLQPSHLPDINELHAPQ